MTMTYSEAIDKLSALCESIMLDYEYEVITEATDENGEKDPSKVKALASKAWAGIKKVMTKLWEIARAIAAKIKARIKAIISHAKKSEMMVLTDEAYEKDTVELHNFTLDPKKAMRVLLLVKRALTSSITESFGDSALCKQMEELLETKEISVKQKKFATVADFFNVSTLMEEVAAVGQKVAVSLNGDENANAKVEMSRKAIQMYKVFQSDYSKFTTNTVIYDKKISTAKNKKEEKRMWNDAVRMGVTQHKAAAGAAFGESATYADLMKFKAMLLAEAAEACDNAAHCVIDPTVQKDIDDIPEERSIYTREYPTDISGGEGLRDDNLEATKELVDNNTKAMDILTDDEGSETITESIDLVFDL